MDFLGNQSSEIKKMKAQLLALEALNLALIEALRPELREKLDKHSESDAEATKTQVLIATVLTAQPSALCKAV